MPDYDTKSIPILDDIIENKDTDTVTTPADLSQTQKDNSATGRAVSDKYNFSDPAEPPQSTPLATSESNTLEAIINDVVKHLMPDLEQQLRFLIQQALEEKLPEKTIRRISR
ncbi:hypothetical protein MNBD_GAMMA06-826 [hydrothermal vent metagenome]|uniref:Uncharacterized protein n=1 Tax=hydrothermal vent metagenome TaxID=652676 RepID=A0A3B0XCQ9_9ZZZZ